ILGNFSRNFCDGLFGRLIEAQLVVVKASLSRGFVFVAGDVHAGLLGWRLGRRGGGRGIALQLFALGHLLCGAFFSRRLGLGLGFGFIGFDGRAAPRWFLARVAALLGQQVKLAGMGQDALLFVVILHGFRDAAVGGGCKREVVVCLLEL